MFTLNSLIIEASGPRLALYLKTAIDSEFCLSEPDGRHDQRLLPDIQSLLSRHGLSFTQLNELGVGVGPGSFTGIRVALATAQGLAMAMSKPLKPINSMLLYAASLGEGRWSIASDARLGEVYFGEFEVSAKEVRCLTEPCLMRLDQLEAWPVEHGVVGDGWTLVNRPAPIPDLSASELWWELLDRSDAMAPENCEPVYLRDTVNWKKVSEQPSPLSK